MKKPRRFFNHKFDTDASGDKGLWCKECSQRRPWKKLESRYEFRIDLFRVWFCDRCGNQLRGDNMTDLALAQELEREE